LRKLSSSCLDLTADIYWVISIRICVRTVECLGSWTFTIELYSWTPCPKSLVQFQTWLGLLRWELYCW
jgi:hypothetical protein